MSSLTPLQVRNVIASLYTGAFQTSVTVTVSRTTTKDVGEAHFQYGADCGHSPMQHVRVSNLLVLWLDVSNPAF